MAKSRAKTDRRPVRADSKTTAELPFVSADPAKFKCGICGKTLPPGARQPGSPPEWPFCQTCWARSQDASDRHRNPGAF